MNRLTTEEFVNKAQAIHSDKYDYSRTIYKNSRTKLVVTCKGHGDFLTSPISHLQGRGCPIDRGIFATNTENFIRHAKEIHRNKYSYDKTDYKNSNTKVIVTDPVHGDFEILPMNHLQGFGYPEV